ncbi:hypothetical protein KI387_020623, partial [Taxus chinensis]
SSELLPEIPKTKTLVNLSLVDENPRRLRGDFTQKFLVFFIRLPGSVQPCVEGELK